MNIFIKINRILNDILSLPIGASCIYASHLIFNLAKSSQREILYLIALSCLVAGLVFLNNFLEYFWSKVAEFIAKKRR